MSLRVLMFGWEYPPLHCGGLGIACQGLVRGLKKHGVDVTMVLPHSKKLETDDCDIIGIKKTLSGNEIKIDCGLTPYQDITGYTQDRRIWAEEEIQLYAPDLIAETERFAKESAKATEHINASVVHAHDWMTYEAGLRAAKNHRVPLVSHIHATELDRTYFNPDPEIFAREQAGLRNSDKVIAVSNYTKQILVQHYDIPHSKISVVHNGIAPRWYSYSKQILSNKYHSKPKKNMVLFVGRLVLQKGTRQFLEMAAAVHKESPKTKFVVVGDGHMLPELMEYACKLKLQDSVLFAGKLSSQEVMELFYQADCFVMPSLSEPFGLVALEAASLGTPLILSRQSGVSEVLPDAFVVDFWDTDKMADCVLSILRDKTLARQMATNALAAVKQISWYKQAGLVESIYRHTISSVLK